MRTWKQEGTTTQFCDGVWFKMAVVGSFFYDPNYGADADGRRGVPITFLEDVEIINIEPDPLKETKLKIEEIIYNLTPDDFKWVEIEEDFYNEVQDE